MHNEELAHELLLDPSFQLDSNGGSGIDNPAFHRIRDSFHQAFWDSLADDFKLNPPCYVRALRVLREIRDGITDLATKDNASEIHGAIDLDFIKTQAEKGVFSWEEIKKMVGVVVTLIKRLQAPKRDDETMTMWRAIGTLMLECHDADKPRTLCKAFEFLLDRVNAMRIDAANMR
jgi:hypothetical protein